MQGNNAFASANEQITNAQIYKKLIEIDKKVTGLETRMTGLETRMTGLEMRMTGLEMRMTRLEKRMTEVEKNQAVFVAEFKHLNERIDTLISTFWAVFGFIGGLLIAVIGFIIYLSGRIGRYKGILQIEEEKIENKYMQKKIKELEAKLAKVMKHVPKAAL